MTRFQGLFDTADEYLLSALTTPQQLTAWRELWPTLVDTLADPVVARVGGDLYIEDGSCRIWIAADGEVEREAAQ